MSDSTITPNYSQLASKLAACEGLSLQDIALADLTTLRLGGQPRLTAVASTPEAAVQALRLCDAAQVPVLAIGGGSNLVVADGPLELVAVVMDFDEVRVDADSGIVRAEAGAVWDDVVAASVEAGLGGIECLSGIPGSAGATPVQNVGAYGAEIADVLTRVRLYDRHSDTVEWVEASALELSYRYSNLKFTQRGLVLDVEMRLSTDGLSAPLRFGQLARELGVAEEEDTPRRPVAEVRTAVLALRRGKGMVLDDADPDTYSAGSFFTNPIIDSADVDTVRANVAALVGDEEAAQMPVFASGEGRAKLSAAWLIERAGFHRGHPGPDAPARLSTKHTLALTNRGSATSAELVALAREVRDGVRERLGVTLEPEPIWVGVGIDDV
ncbi:UDP-N-acetylenolpyruvoylglucosamine reductase [Corynebacterium ciconiae DSM 44920]|uniref:UDP-N-acetylmuramate dehydrogenase n=1 Tax=Corynebacterium ciconiae TaxID=227319 RepID=UPI000A00849D|nr:UDP-N-acetylmuramate dehydrogenase [Corynebacterium ciconiae]WKD62082.1 UDP-N-acetylenolpyruvoylglucosamine reductase [Corynebacterium ciconiae DSM 44920]